MSWQGLIATTIVSVIGIGLWSFFVALLLRAMGKL
jgi:hypothetical protein